VLLALAAACDVMSSAGQEAEWGVAVQAANNTPLVGHGSPRKQKQAGFISRLCGHGKESEDAHVPGKKWVQVFDHTGAK